ncbi:Crp/Fnr family transcriptional regulator [Spirillospora sp. NPDC049652]
MNPRRFFYDQLDPLQFSLVSDIARLRTYKQGARLFLQGSPATRVMLLVTGRVLLETRRRSGDPTGVGVLIPGQLFGDEAMTPVGTAKREHTARAIDSVGVLEIDSRELQRLAHEDPWLWRHIYHDAAERTRAKEYWMAQLAHATVAERLARALLFLYSAEDEYVLGSCDIQADTRLLAAWAGTSVRSVQRVLVRWEEQGIVERGAKLTILEPDRLKSIANIPRKASGLSLPRERAELSAAWDALRNRFAARPVRSVA